MSALRPVGHSAVYINPEEDLKKLETRFEELINTYECRMKCLAIASKILCPITTACCCSCCCFACFCKDEPTKKVDFLCIPFHPRTMCVYDRGEKSLNVALLPSEREELETIPEKAYKLQELLHFQPFITAMGGNKGIVREMLQYLGPKPGNIAFIDAEGLITPFRDSPEWQTMLD